MKKSSFVALVLGTVSSMLFAIGMCMALLPEWNSLKPGIVLGIAGLLLALITIFIWRKMVGKKPIHISGKNMLTILVGIIGACVLGIGMCFSMLWDKMVVGILIGIVGIIILLCLIPLTKGITD